MSIIQPKDLEALKKKFDLELKHDVTLDLFTQSQIGIYIPGRECQYCGETQQLLEELASTSPKIHLNVHDFYRQPEEASALGVERIPALLMGSDSHRNVRFYGIPLGYEFATILEDIITLSKGQIPLKVATRKRIRKIKESVHIKVFVTPG